jgi:hypothetical protein
MSLIYKQLADNGKYHIMSTEFLKYARDQSDQFDGGNVKLGKHVSVYMKQWGNQWDSPGDKLADFTPLVVVSRLVKEGLVVDPVRRIYSETHLIEIGNNLEIHHRNETASYISNLALEVGQQVDKQIGKDTMLMIEAAMKDCGHVLVGESIGNLGVNI